MNTTQNFPERASPLLTSFRNHVPSETMSLSASRVKLVGVGDGASLASRQVVWISLSEEIRKTTNLTAFRTMSTAHFFNFNFPKLLLKIPRKKGQRKKTKEKRRFVKGEKRKQHGFCPQLLAQSRKRITCLLFITMNLVMSYFNSWHG